MVRFVLECFTGRHVDSHPLSVNIELQAVGANSMNPHSKIRPIQNIPLNIL